MNSNYFDSLLNSGPIVEEQYARYKQNPASVDKDWQSLFAQIESSEGQSVASATHQNNLHTSSQSLKFDSSAPSLVPEELGWPFCSLSS